MKLRTFAFSPVSRKKLIIVAICFFNVRYASDLAGKARVAILMFYLWSFKLMVEIPNGLRFLPTLYLRWK